MYDGGKILIGLAGFVAIGTLPIWLAAASGQPAREPAPVPPASASACVESVDYMRASHMDLLDRWRDAVVREGHREYVSSTGQTYDMSLSRTCMGCHANRTEFCVQCHSYAGVDPTCWNCHVEPEGK
jgi:hypothetical protein